MNFIKSFDENWQQQFPHLRQDNAELFVAVSGGKDSIVLLDILVNKGFSCNILHVNFQLREKESERDENFVRSLATQYNLPILVKKADTLAFAQAKQLSIQAAAREIRYSWFKEVAASFKHTTKQAYIVTAHNANDNVETVLINLCRGTGIKGITGIPVQVNNIIRPLLFAKVETIISYATENNLTWVEDSSNATEKYTRNYFRHTVIPALEKAYPATVHNILQSINNLTQVNHVYEAIINTHKKKLCITKGNEIHIPILLLQKSTFTHALLFEIVKQYGFTAAQLPDILQLFNAHNGKYVVSASHRIIKNRKWLIIASHQSNNTDTIVIDKATQHVSFQQGTLMLEVLQEINNLRLPNNIALLNLKKLEFPLLLRKWKQGDYFYPLGMAKKKKLSKFFIDSKLSVTDKEKVWVLESNRKIIWVVGHRIDNRYKVMSEKEVCLKITFQPIQS
jgi:tRNA(Ile)-lysidine synthase